MLFHTSDPPESHTSSDILNAPLLGDDSVTLQQISGVGKEEETMEKDDGGTPSSNLRCTTSPSFGPGAAIGFSIATGFWIVVAWTLTRAPIDSSSYAVVINEYYSPICHKSDLTWRPHRTSSLPADGKCHRVVSFGVPEGVMYAKATCRGGGSPGSTSASGGGNGVVQIYMSPSIVSCVQGDAVEYSTGVCLREDATVFGQYKKSAELQYLQVDCALQVRDAFSSLFSSPLPTHIVPVTPIPSRQLLFKEDNDHPRNGKAWYDLPFAYKFNNYSIPTATVTSKKEISPPLVAGNFSDVSPPLPGTTSGTASSIGLTLNPVVFKPPDNGEETHHPNDPKKGPWLGVMFNGTMTADEDDIRHPYSTSDTVEHVKQSVNGALLYQGLEGTLFDAGHDHSTFTITMWVKCDNYTTGFPFIITDGLFDKKKQGPQQHQQEQNPSAGGGGGGSSTSNNSSSASGSGGTGSPLVDAMAGITFGGLPYNTLPGTDVDWNGAAVLPPYSVYLAVALDGRSQTVSLLGTYEDLNTESDNYGEGGLFELRWSVEEVGKAISRIFDGQWHFIAISSKLASNKRRSARLFVDSETDYADPNWQGCFAKGVDITPINAKQPQGKGPVFFPGEQYVTDHAALFAGAFNGGLFNLQFHAGELSQERVAGFGAPLMGVYAGVYITGSKVLGSVLGVVGIVSLLILFGQLCCQLRDRGGTSNNFDQAVNKAKDTVKEKTKELVHQVEELKEVHDGTGGMIVTHLKVILTLVTGVAQSMALYLRGFQWPVEYEEWLSKLVFPFTLDFTLPSLGFDVSPLVSHLLQCTLVFVAFYLLIFIFAVEKKTFQNGLDGLVRIFNHKEEQTENVHIRREYRVVDSKGSNLRLHKADASSTSSDCSEIDSNEFEKQLMKLAKALASEHNSGRGNSSSSSSSILRSELQDYTYQAHLLAPGSSSVTQARSIAGREGKVFLVRKGGTGEYSIEFQTSSAVAAAERSGDSAVGTKTTGEVLQVRCEQPPSSPNTSTSSSSVTHCPQHESFGLVRRSRKGKKENDAFLCATAKMPWVDEYKGCQCNTKQEDANHHLYCCRRTGCDFAICESCSRMTSDELETCKKRATARSLAAPKGYTTYRFKVLYDNDEKNDKSNNKTSSSGSSSTSPNNNDKKPTVYACGMEDAPSAYIATALDEATAGLMAVGTDPVEQRVCEVGVFLVSGDLDGEFSLKPPRFASGTLYVAAVPVTPPADSGGFHEEEEGRCVYPLFFKDATTGVCTDVEPIINNPTKCPNDKKHVEDTCTCCCRRLFTVFSSLVPGSSGKHLTLVSNLDNNFNSRFQCARYLNVWSGSTCEGVTKEKEFYVCPNCEYTLCSECCDFGITDGVVNWAKLQIRKKFTFDGASTVGYFILATAQGYYIPVIQSSFMLIICHINYSCEFPGCYKNFDSNSEFRFAVIMSGVTLVLIGACFLVFMFVVAYRRKCSILEQQDKVVLEHRPSSSHGKTTKAAGANGGGSEATPRPSTGRCCSLQSLRVWATSTVLLRPISDAAWKQITSQDTTILKPLYGAYEFQYMCVAPLFLFFKVILVVAVCALTPNSLSQLVGSAFAESLQLAFLLATQPFTNDWIDTLSKVGSLHQIYQLSLICFQREVVIHYPQYKGITHAMLIGSGIYIFVLLVVILFLGVIPATREAYRNGSYPNILGESAESKKKKAAKKQLKERQKEAIEEYGKRLHRGEETPEPTASTPEATPATSAIPLALPSSNIQSRDESHHHHAVDMNDAAGNTNKKKHDDGAADEEMDAISKTNTPTTSSE